MRAFITRRSYSLSSHECMYVSHVWAAFVFLLTKYDNITVMQYTKCYTRKNNYQPFTMILMLHFTNNCKLASK